MRVILLKDVEKVGKRYDIKEVAAGHARNFLIPNGLAKPATPEAMKWLDIQKEITTQQAEKELKTAQEIASKLEGCEITILVKVGENQQLFESITAKKITEKLKELGFEIKLTQIVLDNPIKDLGEFPVKVNFEHNLEVEIKVIVSPEVKT